MQLASDPILQSPGLVRHC